MGLKFKRGDCVDYKGGETSIFHGSYQVKTLEPNPKTYVWAIIEHGVTQYVIEHKGGFPKEYFLAKRGQRDGFESIHSSQLQDGLKYAYVDEIDLEFAK